MKNIDEIRIKKGKVINLFVNIYTLKIIIININEYTDIL